MSSNTRRLHGLGVVGGQPVRDPRAAVVGQHVETVEAERAHQHEHVPRHRALGVVGVVGAPRGLLESP